MKKEIAILIFSLVLAAGCIEPAAKLGCCVKENATNDGKCALVNMTTSDYRVENYYDKTNECNVSAGWCNVTWGDTTHLIPICTDATLLECINPDCTAMVCGDFLFKPKVAPGVIATEDDEAQMDVPPEDEEAETVGFYKAQCRFFPMDARLKSIMKTTSSSINVFRIGVGGSFDEYDTYRYYFPLSDKYCNINSMTPGSSVRVDRYMNYFGYNPKASENMPYTGEINECISEVAPENPFWFGHDVPVTTPAGDVATDKYQYQFAEYYKTIYPAELEEGETYGSACVGEEDWTMSEPYKKIDRAFYRKGLAIAYVDNFYPDSGTPSRAAFECTGPQDCYSATCSMDYYSRGTTLKNVSNTIAEVATDCNTFASPSGGDPLVVCAPTTDVTPIDDEAPHFDYYPVTMKLAKIKIELDQFGSGDLTEVNELGEGECGVADMWAYKGGSCIGDCGDMGCDDRCEIRSAWCDFSGNNLGAYECGNGEGALDFKNGDMVVSQDITLETMPMGITIESKPKNECTHFYGENSETDEVDCPIINPAKAYPSAGGFVFFGTRKEGEKVLWNRTIGLGEQREVIGYGFGYSPLTMFGSECNPQMYTDYDIVEIGPPNGTTWQRLMDSFTPLFEERTDEVARSLGESNVNDGELILSSLPWILGYKEWKESDDDSYTISSVAAQKMLEKNIYDYPEPNADGTSALELASHPIVSNCENDNYRSYLLVYPKFIYLFYAPSNPSDTTFGQCEYDKTSGFPKVKTYGWCEPCTISTLAYQEITTENWPYLPMDEVRISSEGETSNTSVCTCTNYGGGMMIWHNFTCIASHVTDIDEYNTMDLMTTGAPRTVPEASLVKERIGDYMKAGVLPVLDLSNEDNWDRNITRCYEVTFPSLHTVCEDVTYEEYDFERLFGEMGAAIVIVDTVHKSQYIPVPSERLEEISRRAAVVRSHCWRCMTAVRLEDDIGAFDDVRFDDALVSLFSDPAIRNDIDVVAFDYSPQIVGWEGYYTSENLSDDVLRHMTSRARTTLQVAQKPSLILDFYTDADSSEWTSNVTESMMRKLAENQGELTDAGIIGIIWMNARNETTTGEAIVSIDPAGVGVKGEYFCTVQKSMNAFANPPPLVMYSRAAELEAINCTVCNSYDIAIGACNRTCDNGGECTLPDGITPGTEDLYKCDAGIVLADCALCNETGGTFECVYTYQNGTVEMASYDSSDISSDLYMDVIAGLSKPQRCCLESSDGTRYTYYKQAYSTSNKMPMVFPKTGGENMSCAQGGAGSIASAAASFCGLQTVPIRNYEVSCTLTG